MRVALLLLAGCSLYGHGDDVCNQAAPSNDPSESLVDPATLRCQTFTQPEYCNDACGPCPDVANLVEFIPTWGACNSACTGLDEATCEATADCRVARDFDIYYRNGTAAYLGCFQTDHEPITSAPCDTLDAEDCSAHDECAGLYTVELTGCVGCNTPTYKACIPEGQPAGTCTGMLTCAAPPPACPTGTTPGRADGCFTGSCIPNGDCT